MKCLRIILFAAIFVQCAPQKRTHEEEVAVTPAQQSSGTTSIAIATEIIDEDLALEMNIALTPQKVGGHDGFNLALTEPASAQPSSKEPQIYSHYRYRVCSDMTPFCKPSAPKLLLGSQNFFANLPRVLGVLGVSGCIYDAKQKTYRCTAFKDIPFDNRTGSYETQVAELGEFLQENEEDFYEVCSAHWEDLLALYSEKELKKIGQTAVENIKVMGPSLYCRFLAAGMLAFAKASEEEVREERDKEELPKTALNTSQIIVLSVGVSGVLSLGLKTALEVKQYYADVATYKGDVIKAAEAKRVAKLEFDNAMAEHLSTSVSIVNEEKKLRKSLLAANRNLQRLEKTAKFISQNLTKVEEEQKILEEQKLTKKQRELRNIKREIGRKKSRIMEIDKTYTGVYAYFPYSLENEEEVLRLSEEILELEGKVAKISLEEIDLLNRLTAIQVGGFRGESELLLEKQLAGKNAALEAAKTAKAQTETSLAAAKEKYTIHLTTQPKRQAPTPIENTAFLKPALGFGFMALATAAATVFATKAFGEDALELSGDAQASLQRQEEKMESLLLKKEELLAKLTAAVAPSP